MLLKRTLFCVFGVMQCVYAVRGLKNTLFSTYCTLLLLLYAPSFWNVPVFTKLIVLRSEACSDWPAIQCIVIGRILQTCDGNVTPPHRIVMRDETKTIKPTINEAFIAFSEDIIIEYNDLYCIFMHCVALHHVCICDRRNAKQALLYTAQNSRLNSQKQIL